MALTIRARAIAAAAITTLTMSAMTVLETTSAQAAAPTAPDHLVISEFYGDGGNPGSTYTYDFVELYNPTDDAISLGSIDGATVTPKYDLCYRTVNGNTCTTLKLYGTVLAHHHFLIREQKGSGTGSATEVTPDLDFSTTTSDPSGQQGNNMAGSGTGGQVLLLDDAATHGTFTNVDNTSNRNLADSSVNPAKVVDAIGYGTTARGTTGGGAEGWTSPTDTHAAAVGTTANVLQRTFTDGVPQETDDNAADFTAGTRAPVSQATSRVTAGHVDDTSVQTGDELAPITVAADKGIAPYTFTAHGLPDGVTIDKSNGVVSGKPTTEGTYPVTVTVADSTPGTPDTATSTFTLTVSDAPAKLSLDRPDDATVDRGAALAPVTVHATGGTAPLTYTATGLPDGITIDEKSGVISGTTEGDAKKYDVHLTVTDSENQQAETDWTLTVTEPAPTPDPLHPGDLFVSEVNNDVTGTDYFEYVEVTNTTSHPIDFAASGVRLRYNSGTYFTFHSDGDTVAGSPVVDPVIPAHGTQLFWSVNTATGSDAYWQKTDANFRSFYSLDASVPVVQLFGQNGLSNSGNEHLAVVQGTTLIADSFLPAEASAANNNSAEHFAAPTSGTTAPLWYDSYGLGKPLITPATVDPAQVGYSHAVKVNELGADGAVELYNTSAAAVDLAGYRLGDDFAITDDAIAAHGYLVVHTGTTPENEVTLAAPDTGYAYTDAALDTLAFTQAPRTGADWGRVPDGTGGLTNVTPSLGASNAAFTTFTPPTGGDPLAQLKINEVRRGDWVELYNTGDALTDVSVHLQDQAGSIYAVPAQNIAAHAFVVVEGKGLTLSEPDTLYLTESDDKTLLDQVSWTTYAPTSLARTTDGTGDFATSAYLTKGKSNSGAPQDLKPNDLLVSEVNYDNQSTDYYEYIEVTNTTSHPIDFAAYGVTLRYGTATPGSQVFTFHSDGDTVDGSPVVDPVVPAHGTQVFWSVNTASGNDAYWQKTDADFRTFYGLDADTPIVQVFGPNGLTNGGARYYEVFQNATKLSSGYVPAANATYSGNYAAHFEIPADRSSPTAEMWFDANAAGKKYVTPGLVDLEQVGFSRATKIDAVSSADQSVTLLNSTATAIDLSGYVLTTKAGTSYTLPAGTTLAGNDKRTVDLAVTGTDWVTLLAPRGYAYADGLGIVDTTGPFLHSLPYDANSGQAPVIDPTTGLPLPPAGGLYRPAGVSAQNGTVFASNTGDNLLAALADGTNTVVAGSLDRYGFDPASQDGKAAADAGLYQPGGSDVDADGNVYLADSGDNVVVKIVKSDKSIHLVAGTGTAGGSGVTITPTSTGPTVNLYRPQSVAVAPNGDLYIADTYDNRVLKVTAAGAASLVAGTGKPGYTGDGKAATAARLTQPADVAVDRAGNVYIADSSNNVIRRVDAGTGVITTVAGDYAANQKQNECLGGFSGDGGPAISARLNDPQGIALDGAGNLFIADTFNNAIRQVSPDGTISTIVNTSAAAGSENTSPTGSGSLPTTTQLNTPYAVTVDSESNALYLADTRNSAIAEVLHVAEPGAAAGPLEPADQVAVTGNGVAFAACDALANPPEITAISPLTGPQTGGTTVTVTGTHFSGTTGVKFGTVPGTGVKVVDDSHLTVVSPAHGAGHVDVSITNAAGTSDATPSDEFTYLPYVPIVSRVLPFVGPTRGGTPVLITGKHLSGTTAVKFGTVAGTRVRTLSDSLVTVVSPAHAAGRIDVTVVGANGVSSPTAADRFTFVAPLPVCTYAVDYTKLGHATAKLGKDENALAHAKHDLKKAHKASTRAKLRKKISGLNRTVAADRRAVSSARHAVRVDSSHSWCRAQVSAVAKLTHAQAKLAKDLRSLAKDKSALRKALKSGKGHQAKTRAALRKRIAALNRTIAADRRAVAAAQRAVAATRRNS